MSDSDNKLLVTVDNFDMPPCSEYSITLSDTDLESGRNIKAKMIRNRVRANMYKLQFKYSLIEDDEIAQKTLKAITPEFFKVTFYSPYEMKRITKKMYAGDKSMNWVKVRGENGEYTLKLQDMSFNFIEE